MGAALHAVRDAPKRLSDDGSSVRCRLLQLDDRAGLFEL